MVMFTFSVLFNTSVNEIVLFMQYVISDNYDDGKNIPITGSTKKNLKNATFRI